MRKEDQDKLEQYVHAHREAFDSEVPGNHVWEGIVKTLSHKTPTTQRNIDFSWMWKAAAIIFFGLSGYLFIRDIDSWTGMANNGSVEFREFQNAENYYNSMIYSKQQELQQYIDKNSPFYEEFKKDVLELDSIYTVLKVEFNQNNDDLIMEAMVRNLQLRIEIMDRQLKIIQKVKKLKNNNENDIAI